MTQTSASPADAAAAQATPRAEGHENVAVSWVHPRGLWSLSLANFALRILTLGIYHFWGRTEVRKRLWSGMRLNGEPLAYTGTGKELFLGFIMVFAVVLLPLLALSFIVVLAAGPQSIWAGIYQGAIYVGLLFLFGLATYRAQRYRLSRTQWRGIRGGMSNNAMAYAWTYYWTGLALPLTLGWLSPWRDTRLQGIITRDMRFGDRHFGFDATARDLYPRFAVLWIGTVLLAIVVFASMGGVFFELQRSGELLVSPDVPPSPATIARILAAVYGSAFVGMIVYGILSAWYRSRKFNLFARHTCVDSARFAADVRARGLIWLTVSNGFILLMGALLATAALSIVVAGIVVVSGGTEVLAQPENAPIVRTLSFIAPIALVFSFGLMVPVTQARTLRYLVTRTRLEGTLPLAGIAQRAADPSTRGEGLAQAFEIDAI